MSQNGVGYAVEGEACAGSDTSTSRKPCTWLQRCDDRLLPMHHPPDCACILYVIVFSLPANVRNCRQRTGICVMDDIPPFLHHNTRSRTNGHGPKRRRYCFEIPEAPAREAFDRFTVLTAMALCAAQEHVKRRQRKRRLDISDHRHRPRSHSRFCSKDALQAFSG